MDAWTDPLTVQDVLQVAAGIGNAAGRRTGGGLVREATSTGPASGDAVRGRLRHSVVRSGS
ncbi:hypothetical protein SLNWT_5191 [Streptomyces albus]|uniref:Uncharacterized protein n=1 Tax=Streptomyces albus (strain ATCC 21838 / DSM 41398 / FERM P-419 / JCM 4703 / NBRC 107858) TaxID=1081613 RepID=A0A0B5F5C2_STRA4|nr:hypothetical protein SLNWT_5191 [Streptomyces albus]AOU79871.1 hypothetical protein SLNHY_5180 [Streptomyces albus]